MNRLPLSLLLAAGLFSLDVTPAAAHSNVDRIHVYGESLRYESRRHNHMPGWVKRDRHFRAWYRHTPLRHYRQFTWNQLYDIYRWERKYFSARRDYDRDDYRDMDRGHRRRQQALSD